MIESYKVVALVGQLAVIHRQYKNEDITQKEFLSYGAQKIANILGVSRYITVQIIQEALRLRRIKGKTVIHREWKDEDGKVKIIYKDVYTITDKGYDLLEMWIEMGRYDESIAYILHNHAIERAKRVRLVNRSILHNG